MKKKNKKINIKNVIKFILILSILFVLIFFITKLKITNIYIKGNTYYSDQEIIDIASLRDYPNTFIYNTLVIKHKLENDLYISNAKVSKKGLT
ncbi:MAG: FtsQ-type POTRA domain-containing protein, partial [Bacilli bacterium]|nr:FtsQ-type POTRA domain-containing protein [Bacilli bacterium]